MRKKSETRTTPSDPLARARSVLASKWLLAILACLTVSLTIVMGSMLEPISPVELVRTQLTFSRDAFVAVLEDWQARGVLGRFRHHFDLDLVIYPITYGLSLASLLAFGLERMRAPHGRDRLLLLPFVASFFDVVENLSHLRFLDDPDAITETAVFATASAASLKWATLVVCSGLIVASLVKGAQTRASTK